MINFCSYVILLSKYSLEMLLPKVPEAAFASRQSSQGGEDLLENELPVLLVTREHLRKSRMQSTKSKHNNRDVIQGHVIKKAEAIPKLTAKIIPQLHAMADLLLSRV